MPTLVTGLVVFGGLAFAVLALHGRRFRRRHHRAGGHGLGRRGQTLLPRTSRSTAANPTNIIYKLKQPGLERPGGPRQAARRQLAASGLFTAVTGPLNPNGATLTPAQFTALHDRLGPPQLLPATPPPGTNIPAIGYQLYRATALYISPDGRTVQFLTGLKAGDPSTHRRDERCPRGPRGGGARWRARIGAADYGVGGEAPALYDISSISNSDLATRHPDRDRWSSGSCSPW